MNRVVEYIIRAKDATASTLEKAMSRIKGFATGVLSNLANIKSGFDMFASAAQKAWALLQKSVQYEKMTFQFKTLIGNIDEAKVHMQMLQGLGDTPPFSLEEFARASRELMKFSEGALGFKDSLELVGDAAAALGQPVEGLANLVGRAYALIRDGQPIQRAGMMLRNVGAVTPEVVAKLQDMEKAGASNIELWRELEKELGRFKGAMADTEQTADGLMGAIQAQWDDAVRSFGEAFLDAAKGGMSTLLEHMKRLNEDGTIEEWAAETEDALNSLCSSVKYVTGLFEGLWKLVKGTIGVAMAFGAGADDAYANGEGFIGQIKAGAMVAKQMWNDTWNPQSDHEEESAKKSRKEEIKERKSKSRQEAEEKAELMKLEKQAKLEADMAEKQAAKEEAEYQKQLEEYYKMLDEEAEAEQKLREELAREEREQEEKRHQQRIRNIQSEVSESEKSQSDAESRLSAAHAAVSKAWGWYKDKASMQSEIDAYNEQKAAEVQWEKDFQKLKDKRRDWRDIEFGKLSAEEEAVRQVALAKEEEKAAQVALDEIVENTAYLKEIAESLSADEGA